MYFLLTLMSGNRKTGPIPVSTSSMETCPSTCPLTKGCYAKLHVAGIHWRKLTQGIHNKKLTWSEFLVQLHRIPTGSLWRHNQAGDLLHIDSTTIDSARLDELISASHHARGFTYTHHPLTPVNVEVIRTAGRKGFTINASCERLSEVDQAMALGVPATVLLPWKTTKKVTLTPEGRRVVTCPAVLRDTNCANCGLCHRFSRNYAIGFPAHGVYAKQLDAKYTDKGNIE